MPGRRAGCCPRAEDLDYALRCSETSLRRVHSRCRSRSWRVRGTAGVFFVLGRGSGADDLIQAIGGKDVTSEQERDSIPATSEALVKLNGRHSDHERRH